LLGKEINILISGAYLTILKRPTRFNVRFTSSKTDTMGFWNPP